MSDTFTICFRLPVRFRAPLKKLAKAAHGSINQVAVIAIEQFIEEQKRKPAPKCAKGKR